MMTLDELKQAFNEKGYEIILASDNKAYILIPPKRISFLWGRFETLESLEKCYLDLDKPTITDIQDKDMSVKMVKSLKTPIFFSLAEEVKYSLESIGINDAIVLNTETGEDMAKIFSDADLSGLKIDNGKNIILITTHHDMLGNKIYYIASRVEKN